MWVHNVNYHANFEGLTGHSCYFDRRRFQQRWRRLAYELDFALGFNEQQKSYFVDYDRIALLVHNLKVKTGSKKIYLHRTAFFLLSRGSGKKYLFFYIFAFRGPPKEFFFKKIIFWGAHHCVTHQATGFYFKKFSDKSFLDKLNLKGLISPFKHKNSKKWPGRTFLFLLQSIFRGQAQKKVLHVSQSDKRSIFRPI